MAEKRPIRVIDSTMRDGSHAMAHQFTLDQIEKIARALDEAGVTTMEISHGDGMGGASYNYGFPKEPETGWLRTAAQTVTNAELAILLIPGIGTQEQPRRGVPVGRAHGPHRDSLHRSRHLAAAHRPGERPGHGDHRFPDALPHDPG